MSTVIKTASEVQGFRFWRQDLPNCTPRFEVFEVVGCNPQTLQWFFRSRSNRCLISKRFDEINRPGFEPFIYVNREAA
jgi:hypothetical protein